MDTRSLRDVPRQPVDVSAEKAVPEMTGLIMRMMHTDRDVFSMAHSCLALMAMESSPVCSALATASRMASRR